MRAFEVYLNGERLCLAGANDESVLSTIIDYVGKVGNPDNEERLHLSVGGLLIPQEEHVRWQERDLAVGDEIRVRILDSDTVDMPSRRIPRDPKKEIRNEQRYVRKMAKKLGWRIQKARKLKRKR
jgi:hypothetical protein